MNTVNQIEGVYIVLRALSSSSILGCIVLHKSGTCIIVNIGLGW